MDVIFVIKYQRAESEDFHLYPLPLIYDSKLYTKLTHNILLDVLFKGYIGLTFKKWSQAFDNK